METDSWTLPASEQKDKVCGKEEADAVTGETPTEESPRSREIEGFRLKGTPSSGKETQQDKQQSHITKFWILRLEKTSYRLPDIKRNKKNQTGVPSPVLIPPANWQSQDAQSFCGEEPRPWSSVPQESMDPVGRERNTRYLRPQEVHLSGPASGKHY